MKDSGIYSLIIELNKDEKIKIGKLGKFDFKKGLYVYTGSALSGLERRIDRHKKKRKKKFWHIDYLLANKHAKISKIIKIETNKRLECKLNKIVSCIPNTRILAEGFGSSDCNCKSHLNYLEGKSIKLLYKQLIKAGVA